MPNRYQSFPHPVLGNGDDFPYGDFSISCAKKVTDQSILQVRFESSISEEEIATFFSEKKVALEAKLICSHTFFSHTSVLESLFETSYVNLPADAIRGEVEAICFLKAVEPIDNYSSRGSHPDFGDMTFNLEKGDILALSNTVRFLHEPVFIPDYPRFRRSFFDVRPHEDGKRHIAASYEDDNLVAFIPRRAYEDYYSNINIERYSSTLYSIIVIPVLIEALRLRRNSRDDYFDHLWFEKLEAIIEKDNLQDEEDDFVLAQKIMGHPLTEGLEVLNQDLLEDREE